MRSHAAGEQCVSVGIRRRHARAADRAAATTDVLDDQGLPQNLSHLVGDDARHNIARTSGGKRHHHGDRSCRITVPLHKRRRDTEADGGDAEESNERHYEQLSAPHNTNPLVIARRRPNTGHYCLADQSTKRG